MANPRNPARRRARDGSLSRPPGACPVAASPPRVAWRGRLASCQADLIEAFRRSAVPAGQVLEGAKPAELPFGRANKLALMISPKAVQALGITGPRSLLLSADEVPE